MEKKGRGERRRTGGRIAGFFSKLRGMGMDKALTRKVCCKGRGHRYVDLVPLLSVIFLSQVPSAEERGRVWRKYS